MYYFSKTYFNVKNNTLLKQISKITKNNFINLQFKPKIIIILDTNKEYIIYKEAKKSSLCIISFSNIYSKLLDKVTFKMIGNSYNINSVYYFLNFIGLSLINLIKRSLRI